MFLLYCLTGRAAELNFNFSDYNTDEFPEGFVSTSSMSNTPGKWEIVLDEVPLGHDQGLATPGQGLGGRGYRELLRAQPHKLDHGDLPAYDQGGSARLWARQTPAMMLQGFPTTSEPPKVPHFLAGIPASLRRRHLDPLPTA